jgi:hypothetical protein
LRFYIDNLKINKEQVFTQLSTKEKELQIMEAELQIPIQQTKEYQQFLQELLQL